MSRLAYSDGAVAIFQGDSQSMYEIPDGRINLTITSPPYYNERDYSQFASFGEYRSLIKKVMAELYRVMANPSFIIWNVSMVTRLNLPAHSSIWLEEAGFFFQKIIIWRKFGSVSRSIGMLIQNPYPTFYIPEASHEHLLVYTKGVIDGRRRKINGYELDINLAQKFSSDVWDIKQVMHGHPQDLGHPAPFPEQLVANCIQFYTYPGDFILDPFLGSGTTCCMAKQLGRRSIGYDIKEEFVKIAVERCRQAVFNLDFRK